MTAQTSNSVTPAAATVQAGLARRMALRFGVALGMLNAAWLLGLQLTGNNPFGPKQVLAQLLVPLAAVASQWVLRRQLAPQKPGVGRALAVGGLTVLVAALISAGSVAGLASGVGEAALARNRAELTEITLADQQARLQTQNQPGKPPQLTPAQARQQAAMFRQQLDKSRHLSVGDMVVGNFTAVLLLGMLLAVPGGIFFRE